MIDRLKWFKAHIAVKERRVIEEFFLRNILSECPDKYSLWNYRSWVAIHHKKERKSYTPICVLKNKFPDFYCEVCITICSQSILPLLLSSAWKFSFFRFYATHIKSCESIYEKKAAKRVNLKFRLVFRIELSSEVVNFLWCENFFQPELKSLC